jgi:hypothetical protein
MSISDYFYSIAPLHGFLGRALAKYMHILSNTCLFQVEGRQYYEIAVESQKPVFYTFWHQQLMPLVSFGLKTFDLNRFVVIVEGRNRGSILSVLTTSIHAQPIKIDMHGSPLAAGRGVLNVIKRMKEGKYTFLTPDGPYGPARELKPGILFIAQKTGAVVVPCGAWTLQAYQLKRWDRYLFVYPRSKLFVVFREPIFFDDNKIKIADLENSLTNELNTARNRARELAGDIREDFDK